MKKLLLFAAVTVCVSWQAAAQATQADSVAEYFGEARQAAAKNTRVWGKNLYGPMLIIDMRTNTLYANQADKEGALQKEKTVFSAPVPATFTMSQGTATWSGTDWAVYTLPLPQHPKERVAALGAGLFQLAKPGLGLKLKEAENPHLEQKDGRIYLRLEMATLKQAVTTKDPAAARKHLTDALTFRKYRHSLFPGAAASENLAEMSVGLAQYTGFILSDRKGHEAGPALIASYNEFLKEAEFSESFAQQTIPMYGYLLYKNKKDWTRDIKSGTNLADYFAKEFNLKVPANAKPQISRLEKQYFAQNIISEETAREEKIK